MRRLACTAPILILVLLTTGCEGVLCPLPYRSLAPFEGKVIDADTKQPIEGAAVLAIYYFQVASFAGSDWRVKDGQDALTDKNGEFKIPRKIRWFVLNRGFPRGTLEIFKPGYGTLWHERAKALGENKSWPPAGKHIVYELPKLETIEERRLNIPRVYSFEKIPYENQRLYIEAINEESVIVGIGPYYIPGDE